MGDVQKASTGGRRWLSTKKRSTARGRVSRGVAAEQRRRLLLLLLSRLTEQTRARGTGSLLSWLSSSAAKERGACGARLGWLCGGTSTKERSTRRCRRLLCSRRAAAEKTATTRRGGGRCGSSSEERHLLLLWLLLLRRLTKDSPTCLLLLLRLSE